MVLVVSTIKSWADMGNWKTFGTPCIIFVTRINDQVPAEIDRQLKFSVNFDLIEILCYSGDLEGLFSTVGLSYLASKGLVKQFVKALDFEKVFQ